jgi:hypothetical protein
LGNEGRWLLDRHGHRWKDNAVLDIRETVSAWIIVSLKGSNSSNIWGKP